MYLINLIALRYKLSMILKEYKIQAHRKLLRDRYQCGSMKFLQLLKKHLVCFVIKQEINT